MIQTYSCQKTILITGMSPSAKYTH